MVISMALPLPPASRPASGTCLAGSFKFSCPKKCCRLRSQPLDDIAENRESNKIESDTLGVGKCLDYQGGQCRFDSTITPIVTQTVLHAVTFACCACLLMSSSCLGASQANLPPSVVPAAACLAAAMSDSLPKHTTPGNTGTSTKLYIWKCLQSARFNKPPSWGTLYDRYFGKRCEIEGSLQAMLMTLQCCCILSCCWRQIPTDARHFLSCCAC